MERRDQSFARIDRWMTLSVVARLASLRSRLGVDRGAQPKADTVVDAIPILMYHSIADDVDHEAHPYFRTVTKPATFARHVDLLLQDGYEAITLSEATRLLGNPGQASRAHGRKVVLTFDDGFSDFRTAAFPILERAGYRASVFLASDFIGKPFVTGRPCLDAGQVRELSDKGIEFGSHSASHRRLVELGADELRRELTTSKDAIEQVTGVAVTLFSYPYRFPEENLPFTRLLVDSLEASGYRAGVTTAIGRSRSRDPALFLPRLPVNDCDDDDLLRAKLDGHYDWLRRAQLARKQARSLLRSRVSA